MELPTTLSGESVMNKIASILKLPKEVLTTGEIGIEIEVEGDNLPRPQEYWRCEADGSLRGESMEYVLDKPLSVMQSIKSLHYLDNCYRQNNTEVHESVRAGVHVHINVQNLTAVEMFSFITAYIILEDLLIKYCGEYREGNLFCLGIKDADYLLMVIEKVAKGKEYRYFDSSMLRYASLNVTSLWKYGSLEFRAMRGTREMPLIIDWVKVLNRIKNKAIEFTSPKHLVEWVVANGTESFLETFLGSFKGKVDDCKGDAIDVTEGLVRASPLALHTDWDSFDYRDIGGIMFKNDVMFPDEPEEDV